MHLSDPTANGKAWQSVGAVGQQESSSQMFGCKIKGFLDIASHSCEYLLP